MQRGLVSCAYALHVPCAVMSNQARELVWRVLTATVQLQLMCDGGSLLSQVLPTRTVSAEHCYFLGASHCVLPVAHKSAPGRMEPGGSTILAHRLSASSHRPPGYIDQRLLVVWGDSWAAHQCCKVAKMLALVAASAADLRRFSASSGWSGMPRQRAHIELSRPVPCDPMHEGL